MKPVSREELEEAMNALEQGKPIHPKQYRRINASLVRSTRGFGNRKASKHKASFRRHEIAQGWREK